MKSGGLPLTSLSNTCSILIKLVPIIVILSDILLAQPSPLWKKTPAPYMGSRINDGYFVSPTVGWVVSGAGQIQRTTDGGVTWQKMLDKTNKTHFRSIGFMDSSRGWAGALGVGDVNHPEVTDASILYQSTDAGNNWLPVTALNSSIQRGFCGMHVFNKSVINAVGRVRGPAYFYRTTNAGQTWEAKDMRAYAAGLIDVYFFHPDTGLAVGLTHVVHDSSYGMVLLTTDGGQTWETKFKTSQLGEWCWKISFSSRNVGYVSLQRNSQSENHFLKTTDGGLTWTDKPFPIGGYFLQGIGFANDSVGWIGGLGAGPIYETQNGGNTWYPIGLGRRINRFRMVTPTLGYVMGDSVYKYSDPSVVHVAEDRRPIPASFDVRQNYPNPFNPSTKIRVELPVEARMSLRVYNYLGQELALLFEGVRSAGSMEVVWDGEDGEGNGVPSGVYLYRVHIQPLAGSDAFIETRKMLLLR